MKGIIDSRNFNRKNNKKITEMNILIKFINQR